ncbi:unnamed protein product [[Actinomadura] parvosata subsp. kistnae]|uniref:Uncharacterized protein n=1 Tax=[Actinomadura] parvosata subsp. kistnae TaxID=1909395 RepID=A0A1V0AEJ6_9ACTN|nr:hypothetical protein [Nonomuraea sp. ATCC 55076]AQZ68628.1 hypothetical protein BKM31_50530 [Nonomuraea sp. ATCC 55076]SPL92893.1 unnamed protein product [Actinomadura parvosata subsp. kistnae]
MRHTENDLRDLLTERAEDQDGDLAQLGTILRRGRRIRRTRRAVTAGVAALAVAALAVIGLPLRPEGAPVAQQPVDSARVEPPPGPEIPATFEVRLGAEQFDLPLIHSERFGTLGRGRSVTFTPTSTWTGYKVVCEDPQAWVVTAHRLKGGERGGAAARCGDGLGGQHDRLSAPADWLERPQSLQVWVFPSDAPVLEVARAVRGCRKTGCDESALISGLLDPKVRKRLEAEVGERPGRWAVGIYDRPASSG